MWRYAKILGLVLVLLGLGGGGVYYWYHRSAGSGVTFRTAEVTVGDMIPTISATGTVEPLDSIDVGAQVAGQILSFGKDSNGNPIDYRSPVEKDAILAKIDPELYNDDLASAQATLDAANAMPSPRRRRPPSLHV